MAIALIQDDLHPADDHSHKFFVWLEWIAANGPLTAESAFEYFTTSMFYDKQSSNQVLRMQTMHTGLPIVNEAEELRRFTGVEFALVHAQPPSLFIIHKRHRLSPDEVQPLVAYFIINNRIYQSPDVYSVLSNRLLTAVHSLQTSLDTLRRYRPDYAPRTGFIWPIVEGPTTTAIKPKTRVSSPALLDNTFVESPDTQQISNSQLPSKASALEEQGSRKQENLNPMLNAMRTTAAHLHASFTRRPDDTVTGEITPETVSQSSATPFGQQIGTPVTAAPTPSTGDSASRMNVTSKKRKKRKPLSP